MLEIRNMKKGLFDYGKLDSISNSKNVYAGFDQNQQGRCVQMDIPRPHSNPLTEKSPWIESGKCTLLKSNLGTPLTFSDLFLFNSETLSKYLHTGQHHINHQCHD